jgi:Neurotransmitter-gated ion-channel ligand binding domain
VWLTIGQFSSSCEIDVKWFPFDQQKCDMTFVVWSEVNDTSWSIPIVKDAGDDANHTEEEKDKLTDGEWQIVGELFAQWRLYQVKGTLPYFSDCSPLPSVQTVHAL